MSDYSADFDELRRRIFKDGSQKGFLRALDAVSAFIDDLRQEISGDDGDLGFDKSVLDNLRKEAGEPNGQVSDPANGIPDMIKDAMVEVAKESPETPLSVLGLKTATYSYLCNENIKGIGHINTVERLERLTDEQLIDIYGIGQNRFKEIKSALDKYRNDVTETSLDWLGLGTLLTNYLIRGGVNYIEELEQRGDDELDDIPYIGPKRIAEIRKALEEYYAQITR